MKDNSEFKDRLLKEIARTEKLIVGYRELSAPIEPDCAIGRVSRMDAINNKSVTEASLRQAEKKLEGLQRVLGQLGTSDFGICLKCRRPIPPERLLIRPESLFCIHCAE